MPLDPNIVLRGLPPPTPLQSPLEALQLVEQLRDRREQGEARRQALEDRRQAGEERRQKAADEAAARQRALAVEQHVQGAIRLDPATGRPTLDFAALLGGDVPAETIFKLTQDTDQAAQRLATLHSTNMDIDKKNAQIRGAFAQPVVTAGYAKPAWDAAVLASFNQQALTAEQRDAAYAITDPAQIKAATDNAITLAGLTPKPTEGFTLSKGQVRYGPAGEVIATGPTEDAADKHSPAYVEWQDYKASGGTLDFDAYMTRDANRKAVQVRVNNGQGSADDVKQIVQGMIDGTLPPQLPGRASPAYNAIMAEAQRRGYHLASAVTDWAATQKHLATMNGAQQLRLNQAVNALPEMLTSVETLAKQWKGSGFPILNRAALTAAKGGALGPKAATIANKLDAQIADVVADLGNVYMGGNSPTDHALSLAQKSLRADWSEAVLLEMVALAKQNVQIRRNSINSTGVAGASAENPYMPAPAPAAPADPLTVTAPNGTTYTFKTAAEAAAFKRRAGIP